MKLILSLLEAHVPILFLLLRLLLRLLLLHLSYMSEIECLTIESQLP